MSHPHVEKLKPCPFCANQDVGVSEHNGMFSVICGCDAEGPWAWDRALAVQHWNKRPAEPA